MSRPVGTGGSAAYRIPGLGRRIAGAAARLIPIALLLVGVPAALLAVLASHGIAGPVPLLTVTAFGVAIAGLATARYLARPTAALGPLSIAAAATTLFYVLVLLASPTYSFAIPGSAVTVSFSYRLLAELLLGVPLLALLAGVVTTIEDARSPRERLPYDFSP